VSRVPNWSRRSDSNRRPEVYEIGLASTCISARSSIASILMVTRTARTDDLGSLRNIERSAGEAFRRIGMAPVADDEPASIDDLAVYQQEGRAWVATDEDDRPVAYTLARIVDSNAHIEQVSVHPNHARKGIGADLIQTVAAWAEQQGSRRSRSRHSRRFPGMLPTTGASASRGSPKSSSPMGFAGFATMRPLVGLRSGRG
jgi:GNAT superfamily N-acetyltransferase